VAASDLHHGVYFYFYLDRMNQQPTIASRRNELDWLRVIAILILLFYHTGMMFVPWGWHIKNNKTDVSFAYWMIWLHDWRMPLLLFISGAGTYMALSKRTPGQFAAERAKKLLLPLIFGMLVIVPPQIYYEKISLYENFFDFYKTVFQFVPYPEGNFSWHHLWFVAYLFLFSLIALPFLIFLRNERSLRFKSRVVAIMSKPFNIVIVPAIAIIFTQVLLRPYFPEETHDLIHDWAYFMYCFCFFVFGMLFYSESRLWSLIENEKKILLIASIIMLLLFYTLYLHFRNVFVLPFNEKAADICFEIVATVGSWVWVITIIGYAQRYLTAHHPWLKHFNEGLYPFYILHQTVIIIVGYYVCQLDLAISIKFFIVAFLTLFVCVLFYLFLIRPFNLVRILFGMKSQKKSFDRLGTSVQ
jgi:glucans biosynthesis protein C